MLGDYCFWDSDLDDEDGYGSYCVGIFVVFFNDGCGVVGVCWGGIILLVWVMVCVCDWVRGIEILSGFFVDIVVGIKFVVDFGV